jgi:hypothetical protein
MPGFISELRPGHILAILLLELALLFTYIVFELTNFWIFGQMPNVIGGVLPIVVPWGGAVGGVSIALVGLTSHWRNFEGPAPVDGSPRKPSFQARKWNSWYLTRLPLGTVFGTVAAFIVVLFIGTIGVTSGGGIDVSSTGQVTLFVIAFVVGYQQEVFRKLLERVVTVVLGPGTDAPKGVQLSADVSEIAFEATAKNARTSKKVTITNESRRLVAIPVSAVSLATGAFSVRGLPSNIPAGGELELTVEFAPKAQQDYSEDLTITVDEAVLTIHLTGTGT